jgi:DNA-directed RNA polymerase subunit RPC12/RpoP
MCTYAMVHYKVHYVCLPCRRSHKQPWHGGEHRCARCRRPMLYAGHDFAAPRRADERGWRAVAAVLEAGLRYEGFEPCGCGQEPKYRPRTSAQVRARRRVAARTGLTEAEALALRDPSDASPFQG